MPADDLADIAIGIFGADRVDVASRLDRAIEMAVEIADQDDDFGGAGVLVTGSVVTAGEARRLLKHR
jgi:dihydrofolate synthase/folylpolyglutamate synthase